MSQMPAYSFIIVLLNIRHYLLMGRKGISPTPKFIISAKASNHVTPMMHERALVQYLIAETYYKGRFYQQAFALHNYAFSPLLYMSDKNQYHCAGT